LCVAKLERTALPYGTFITTWIKMVINKMFISDLSHVFTQG